MGKNVWFFVPIQGPHTGIDEATPAGKILRQYFEHFGFAVLVELYVPSEFHERKDMSTQGRPATSQANRRRVSWIKLKRMPNKIAKSL